MIRIVLLRGGILLLLGISGSMAVVAMSQPAVGIISRGWIWALAAALLFPLTAAILAMVYRPSDVAILVPEFGVECLTLSLLSAAAIASAQIFWLRRGAPVNPPRAGWLVGVSSGALGAAAYGLHCPFNSIFYVGLWVEPGCWHWQPRWYVYIRAPANSLVIRRAPQSHIAQEQDMERD
ncbi:MAG: NrsF family protein [Parasphingorhabdus sp.]|nr:NrsF family protein [Parasphingorhabdus sp.]